MAQAMGFYTDTTVCIGCKACQVACHQWNGLPAELAEQPSATRPGKSLPITGNSYDNTGSFSDVNWRHVKFIEKSERPDRRDLTWLMMSDVCKHCVNAPCLEVCPTGAIIRTEFDSVYIQSAVCNGCRACVSACPFGVIHMGGTENAGQGTAKKCTLCYDRLQNGLQPACAAACPTESIQFGPIEELKMRAQKRVAALQATGQTQAQLYGADERILGGLNSFYLLVDEPETYGLPRHPQLPSRSVRASSLVSLGSAILLGLAALLSFRRRGEEQGRMTRITVAPEWEWLLVWYFFLGGLAAGLYFIAALIELVGSKRDRAMAKVAYYYAFPLAVVCGVLLILDLGRPERFWHMLIQSETGRPMFKYWSPMSVGAWALLVFSGLAFLSFVGVLAEDGRVGLGRWRTLAHALHRGLLGKLFALLCAGMGFFLASYTGVLLAASNQPFWSDTRWLGGLFLASAAATGTALMLLLRLPSAAPAALARLQRVNSWALGLELLLFIGFLVSLGGLAMPLLQSSYGRLLILVTGLLGLVLPLILRLVRGASTWATTLSCLLVLIGGFEMRYSILMVAQHLGAVGR